MNFISGEKIQTLCDHFLCTKKDFLYNKKLENSTHKCIYIEELDKEYDNKECVFSFTI